MSYTKVVQNARKTVIAIAAVFVLGVAFTITTPNVQAAPAAPAPSSPPSQSQKAGGDCSNIEHCDLINKYIEPFIAFLSAAVGVAVVGSIIVGGVQYSSSANDPSKVTAAKNRIRNAIIALLAYIFLFSLLNFLVPGGIL